MIVLTGGAGFIGSCFLWALNQAGIEKVVVLDDLGCEDKWKNLSKRRFDDLIPIKRSLDWLDKQEHRLKFVVHMGACSSTTEQDGDYLISNNAHTSMRLWEYCVKERIPFIYASSASVYGAGEYGYSDSSVETPKFNAMNKYGFSKLFFDRWVLRQEKSPHSGQDFVFLMFSDPTNTIRALKAVWFTIIFNKLTWANPLNFLRATGQGSTMVGSSGILFMLKTLST